VYHFKYKATYLGGHIQSDPHVSLAEPKDNIAEIKVIDGEPKDNIAEIKVVDGEPKDTLSYSENTIALYYADWCPHCVEPKAVFDKLIGRRTTDKKLKSYNIIMRNIDEDPAFSKVPTIIKYDKSQNTITKYLPRPVKFTQLYKWVTTA
jgi:thiol-disulfide isomerase/thioredoxin